MTRILVTGGGGFLGGAIVRQLVERGETVRVFSRGHYPGLDALGVEHVRGDLGDGDAVARAVQGCDVVVHTAAKAGVWGSWRSYLTANVVGTEHVLAACRAHGIGRLVYTSSPSVTFGGRDQRGADETEPYPARYLAHYPHSKAMAERAVLAANGPDLATVALRPHLIWGPGDPHLVPRLWERARAGKLKLVGDGSNRVDSVYVDNAALAHVLAVDRLAPGAACAGKAFFVSNDEPMAVKDLINGLLATADIPPVTASVSPRVAYVVGAVLEAAYALVGSRAEPPMTRFVARQLATDHWFDLTALRRDLGYAPTVSIAEGFERLRASLG